MKVNRLLISILTAISLVPLYFGDGTKTIGMSVKIINNYEYTQGGTSLWAIVSSLCLILVLWLIFDEKEISITSRKPKYLRRFWALFIDFFVGMVMISGVIGIIPAIYESIRTREVTVYFERNFVLYSDWVISMFCAFLLIFFLLLYVIYPVMKNRQTFGLFITGMKIIFKNDTSPTFKQTALRWIFVFFAICALPVTLLIGKDGEGLFWHEKYSGTKIVLTDQVE